MAKRPVSISVDQLNTTVRAAVAVVAKSNPALAKAAIKPQFFPGPGIVGFILRDRDLAASRVSDVAKLSSSVASKVKGVGTAATLIGGGHIICGFWPEPPIGPFGPFVK